MYYICTREWFDGILWPELSDSYSSLKSLKRALKKFNYDGGCWQKVRVYSDDSDKDLLYWDQMIYFPENIEKLKKLINDFIDE